MQKFPREGHFNLRKENAHVQVYKQFPGEPVAEVLEEKRTI